MNKSAIQKYAIWARNELRDQIAKRGYYFGIDADGINVDGKDETCVYARDGRLLTDTERKQRNELFRLVKEKGFDQVVEEVSYTWFNRLIALRFMEVNDYLPEHIRVLSDANNEFKPEIKTRALDLEDPHFDKKKILDLIDRNDDEELYRYLLLTECNALNDLLPQMFEKIGGYTELLLPKNLLKADSIIGKLVSDIDEADWDVKSEGGQVQIIGWLYQYYNQELKDLTFNDLKKKNKKISKERIPAATQLFTPDWIVHYMVENSLGRMWIEGHPNDELKSTWKYYLDEADQEPQVEEQLKEIRKEYSKLNPQDIKFLDPAMGSGHILVVAFDILMQIYESQGIRPREAAKSILENNLYGLDIDDRAAQLAYFAVMMKARESDRRIFSRGVQPNLYSIQESNGIDDSLIDYVAGGDKELYSDLKTLVKEMKDAKEYGSIIMVSELDFDRLEERLDGLKSDSNLLGIEARAKITPVVNIGKLLAQKYEIVATNPPYMGSNGMSQTLSKYLKEQFPDSKNDLYAVFMETCQKRSRPKGLLSMITQHSWMFIGSYEKLRNKILSSNIMSMLHLGSKAFEEIDGEVVQTTSFTIENWLIQDYKSTYVKLTDLSTPIEKKESFLSGMFRYYMSQNEFRRIPGTTIAYWAPKQAIDLFEGQESGEQYNARVGLMTTDNDRFLRFFWEVNLSNICFNAQNDKESIDSNKRWFPHNKGGSYRKWYGNQDYVVDWERNGERIKRTAIEKYPYLNGNPNFVVHDDGFYFRENLSWSEIAVGNLAFRYFPKGFTYNVKGMSAFPKKTYTLMDGLAYLNSNTANYLANIINPSISFGVNSFNKLPFLFGGEEARQLAVENVRISEQDWDSFEISWNFRKHPLIKSTSHIKDAFTEWEQESTNRFNQLKTNEQRLNEIFINISGLSSELSPEVLDENITISKPCLTREIKGLISYAVGCMFGRYSLDSEGLIYAGGQRDIEKYKRFSPHADDIIPVTEFEYFSEDITDRFVEFIRISYGEDSLNENLSYIAEVLGDKTEPRETIRRYFLKNFYSDHVKMYQKRPIYWLFDSGKKNGFKCLIYMHRYTPDTLARIRTDYVHEQQERYRSQIKHIQETIDTVPKSEQVKMKKELKDLEAKSKEVAVFEEKLHHLADQMIEIDLDDGVKHNYALFQDVLAKIK